MVTHTFISHSSKDNAIVRTLAHALREHGVEVWVDLDALTDGARWLREIQDGVEQCAAIVIVMSRAARESEWVEREALLALNLHKPLFIALIEDVPLPLHLINRQYTDFRHDFAAAAAKLAKAIQATIASPISSKATPITAHMPSPTPNEDNFFDYLKQLPDGDMMAIIARDLYNWSQTCADAVTFGGKHTPAFHAQVKVGDKAVIAFSLMAYMRNPAVQIPLDYLRRYPPFTEQANRLDIIMALNELLPPDETLDPQRADRRPTLSLLPTFATADKLELFKQLVASIMMDLR